MEALKVIDNAPSVYEEKMRIRSYHTDVRCRLTIPKLCSFFQEVAGNHTYACGVGWEVMKKENVFWALSRLKIEVDKYPALHDYVTIRTWSNGTDGPMAIRHFQVFDESQNVIIKAISSWLIVNIETRHLVRPDECMRNFPLCDVRLFPKNLDKIEKLANPVERETSFVRFTETDMNMHVNNVCYIERIINTFDYNFLKQNEMSKFEINFIKEARMGDELTSFTEFRSINESFGSIASLNGNCECVRMKMDWRKL